MITTFLGFPILEMCIHKRL